MSKSFKISLVGVLLAAMIAIFLLLLSV